MACRGQDPSALGQPCSSLKCPPGCKLASQPPFQGMLKKLSDFPFQSNPRGSLTKYCSPDRPRSPVNQLLFACTAQTHVFVIFIDYLDVASSGSWHLKWRGPSACFELASARSDGGSMGEKGAPGEPRAPMSRGVPGDMAFPGAGTSPGLGCSSGKCVGVQEFSHG